MTKTSLYKDTITDLNKIWSDLTKTYLIGDTRAIYLRRFELALSQNCPDTPLWYSPTYMRISSKYPLPKDVSEYISRQRFYLYLQTYEMIMREIGLVGKKDEDAPDVKLFDMKGI